MSDYTPTDEEEREKAARIRISDGMIQRAREAMYAQTGHYPTITAAIEILSTALDGEQADREPSAAEGDTENRVRRGLIAARYERERN